MGGWAPQNCNLSWAPKFLVAPLSRYTAGLTYLPLLCHIISITIPPWYSQEESYCMKLLITLLYYINKPIWRKQAAWLLYLQTNTAVHSLARCTAVLLYLDNANSQIFHPQTAVLVLRWCCQISSVVLVVVVIYKFKHLYNLQSISKRLLYAYVSCAPQWIQRDKDMEQRNKKEKNLNKQHFKKQTGWCLCSPRDVCFCPNEVCRWTSKCGISKASLLLPLASPLLFRYFKSV